MGSSLACVCPYCRFSVVRTDRDLRALGKVADLVPTAPMMAVGDAGKVDGRNFVVGGRLQLDHGRGPWDEWYVEFDNGRWGWLSHAQGHFYVTHPVQDAPTPRFEDLSPEDTVTLSAAGNTTFTVVECGHSRLLSAEGELPFAAVPDARGRYADLESATDGFATIDYGDGSEPASLFLGQRFAGDAVELTREGVGPRPQEVVEAERLRCPTCGAPVPIRLPDSTERAACGHCNSLLDYNAGRLQYLKRLEQREVTPSIPLGSEGVLCGEQCLVVGFMERFAVYDGVRYPWQEYLLHTKYGYRWLTEDSGHFVYMRPVSAAQVQQRGSTASFRGQRYKAFQSGNAEVGVVLGEFYWRVETGDQATTQDFVAPPNLLSSERTRSEVNWSHGVYVPSADIWKGLSLPGRPPPKLGVAPCEPNPIKVRQLAAMGLSLLVALGIAAFVVAQQKDEDASLQQAIAVPDLGVPGAQAVTQTAPFEIAHGPTTVEVALDTDASNAWLGLQAALVNEETGEVREFYLLAEDWHGVSGGESWQEGDADPTEYLSRVPSGRYSVRVIPEWGTGPGGGQKPTAQIRVRPGERSALCCFLSGFLILAPLGWALVRKAVFEGRRWRQSDMAESMLESD